MIVKKIAPKDSYILVFKKGNDIIGNLLSFCKDNDIMSASVFAIGAVSKAKLGFYDLSGKKYISNTLDKPMEIASLSGNITKMNDEHIAHIHAVFSDKNMKTHGGHLIEAEIAVTCEIYLTVFNEVVSREHDDIIGLNLISD